MSSGFVAGTLVHTDKGLIPIQNLQVGDLIITNTINGTEYKEIIKTHKNDYQQIFQLIIRQMQSFEDEFIFIDEVIYLTDKQKIFIQKSYELELENQWMNAESLTPHDTLSLINNLEEYYVQSFKEVLRAKDEIGLCLKVDDYEIDYETYIKYGNLQPFPFAYDLEFPDGSYQEVLKLGNLKNLDLTNNDEKQIFDICFNYWVNCDGSKPMILPTYTVEIEDFHAYFVGEQGLWVGDTTM